MLTIHFLFRILVLSIVLLAVSGRACIELEKTKVNPAPAFYYWTPQYELYFFLSLYSIAQGSICLILIVRRVEQHLKEDECNATDK